MGLRGERKYLGIDFVKHFFKIGPGIYFINSAMKSSFGTTKRPRITAENTASVLKKLVKCFFDPFRQGGEASDNFEDRQFVIGFFAEEKDTFRRLYVKRRANLHYLCQKSDP